MTKSVFCALVFTALSTLAHAADGAKFRAIGFSEDAQFFGFEQYGELDGSGFTYSDIFLLDVAADNWVKGTPLRTELEEESVKISKVRAKAKAAAKPYLEAAGITVDPEILASNPFTEMVADRMKLTFHDHYNNGMGSAGNADNEGTWTLSLGTVPVALPAGCEADMGVTGYKLQLSNNKTKDVKLLRSDKSLPKSRGCAVGYDLEAIVQPVGGSDAGQLVAIIGVYSRGFEGADRRFIAVPFKFN